MNGTLFAKISASLVLGVLVSSAVLATSTILLSGNSGDSWEKPPAGYQVALEQPQQGPFCQPLTEDQVELVTDRRALAQLEESSVTNLNDTSAARLLRNSVSANSPPDSERLRSLIGSNEINGYKPYLVRAFRWPDRATILHVDLCGEYIRTTVDTAIVPNPKPERAAAIVFVSRAPKGSFGVWIQSSRPARTSP